MERVAPSRAPGQEEGSAEESLVRSACQGLADSLAELVRRYRPAVVTVARGITRSAEAAEDIAQESLVAALCSLRQLREPRRFGSWLYAITRHRALRYVEERRKPPATSSLEAEGEQPCGAELGADPARDYEEAESSHELREAIERLPIDYRIALELRYWNDMSMAEMAEFLSVPVSTVKWRLHAAKRALERALTQGRSGDDDHSG